MTRTGYTTIGSNNWTPPPPRTAGMRAKSDGPLYPMEQPSVSLLRRLMGRG